MVDTRAHFVPIVVALALALFGAGWLLFSMPVEAPDGAARTTATSAVPADTAVTNG